MMTREYAEVVRKRQIDAVCVHLKRAETALAKWWRDHKPLRTPSERASRATRLAKEARDRAAKAEYERERVEAAQRAMVFSAASRAASAALPWR
jgi:hypothetical protein